MSLRHTLRADLCLALLVLATLGPFVQDLTAQPAARYALTAALSDDRSVDLSAYESVLGVDKVAVDGELRSDKAPAQPLLAVPAYALARLAGAEPATHLRVHENLGLWWVTLWSSLVPFVLLLVLMRRAAIVESHTLDAALAIGFGTMLLAYATQLYGHLMASLFLFGSWLLIRGQADGRRALAAGVLAGLAVATEYQTAPAVLVVVVATLIVDRRTALRFVVGMLPVGVVTALYHQAAFGRPWRVAYSYREFHESGLLGVGLPRAGHVVDVLVGDRGLALVSPLVLVAVGTAAWLALRPGPRRREAAVSACVFAAMFVVQVGTAESAYGGEAPGPRYLIPALPFLAGPLAAAWADLRRPAIVAAAWGLAVNALPVLTSHLVPLDESLLRTLLHRLGAGEYTPTLWTMTLGPAGRAVHLASVLAITALAIASMRGAQSGSAVRRIAFDEHRLRQHP